METIVADLFSFYMRGASFNFDLTSYPFYQSLKIGK